MENNKLSHKNPEVISDLINELKKHFGDLYVVGGNMHNFLGTNIEKKDRMAQVNMVEKLEDCIEMFGEDVSTLVTYPATKKLF